MVPQFQYTILLAALILVPIAILIYIVALQRKKRSLKKIGDPELVNQLMGSYRKKTFLLKFSLVALALTVLILALANPRVPAGENKVTRNGIDVMIALDVSKSMLAEDVKPNRLERAKQLLTRLIDRLDNDRIGLVVFAGKAYMQMPMSSDHAAAKMYLSAATPESIPTQGTVLGDALKMCYAAFDPQQKKYKAVILVSDGEDHDESADKVASDMASEGVVIHTVGIGSPEGAPIMDQSTGDLKRDNQGNTVITKLNEGALKSIASNGNGEYQFFANSDNVVSNLSNMLATMDQRAVKDDSLINYTSYYTWFVGAAFLFLLIEIFISETRKRKKMNRLKPAIATLLSFVLISAASAQTEEKKIIRQGNEAYKAGNYTAAASSYGSVVKSNPGNNTAQYNLGNALYKSKEVDASIAAYDNVIAHSNVPINKSMAYYNKGVVLQNNEKIPECIEAYKNCLKINPNDEDARQNLQKALRKQKEDKQKEDQKKDQENKDQQQKPKPQQSKLSEKEAEDRLKALMQQEKNLQDKLHKVNAPSVNRPEKDW